MRLINTSILIMVTVLLILVSQAFGQEKRKVEVQCGEYKVAITCGHNKAYYEPGDTHYCNDNKLTFTGRDGKVFTPKTPKRFNDFVVPTTPMGLWCELANNGRYYVTVEFNSGPMGCGPCTILDLFEANGKRLTVKMKQLDKISEKLGLIGKKTKQIRIEWDDPGYRKLHEEGKI